MHYCTTNEPRTKIGNSMLVISFMVISSKIMHRKKVIAKIRVFMDFVIFLHKNTYFGYTFFPVHYCTNVSILF